MRGLLLTVTTLFGLMLSKPAAACDVTLADGADLAANVAAFPGKEICLQRGIFVIGPSELVVPAGTTIRGLPEDRAGVVVASYGGAQKAIGVESGVTLRNFTLLTNQTGDFGILSYHSNNVLLWSLKLIGYKINIGVVGGNTINIWDTFVSDNGIAGNNNAEPNFWITDSENVTILYGELKGRADGPGGDGELAVYSSKNVVIDGTHVIDSGASAIYLVSCTDCTVKNAVIERAGEWGLDVVQGSTRFVAQNNRISWSNYGGSVFETTGGATATYTGNSFVGNRRAGIGNCNGINAKGGVAGIVQSQNISSPAGVICSYP